MILGQVRSLARAERADALTGRAISLHPVALALGGLPRAIASADNKVTEGHRTGRSRPHRLGQPLTDHRRRFGGMRVVTLSRTSDACSPPTSAESGSACRGRQGNLAAGCGRPRTNANEAEVATTRAQFPVGN